MGAESQQKVTNKEHLQQTLQQKVQIKAETFPLHVHLLEQIPADWLDGLQTQSVHVGGSIISTQGCQVNKSDSL